MALTVAQATNTILAATGDGRIPAIATALTERRR